MGVLECIVFFPNQFPFAVQLLLFIFLLPAPTGCLAPRTTMVGKMADEIPLCASLCFKVAGKKVTLRLKEFDSYVQDVTALRWLVFFHITHVFSLGLAIPATSEFSQLLEHTMPHSLPKRL